MHRINLNIPIKIIKYPLIQYLTIQIIGSLSKFHNPSIPFCSIVLYTVAPAFHRLEKQLASDFLLYFKPTHNHVRISSLVTKDKYVNSQGVLVVCLMSNSFKSFDGALFVKHALCVSQYTVRIL